MKMNTTNGRKCSLLIGLMVYAVACMLSSDAYANTVRHIYNNSSHTIRLVAHAAIANVYFLDCPKGNVKNGPCSIPPHSSIAMEFTTSHGAFGGTLFIAPNITKDALVFDVESTAQYLSAPVVGCHMIDRKNINGKIVIDWDSPAGCDVSIRDR